MGAVYPVETVGVEATAVHCGAERQNGVRHAQSGDDDLAHDEFDALTAYGHHNTSGFWSSTTGTRRAVC